MKTSLWLQSPGHQDGRWPHLCPVYPSRSISCVHERTQSLHAAPLVSAEGGMRGASSSLALFAPFIMHFCVQRGSPAVPTSGQLPAAWVCIARPLLAGIHSYCFQYLLAANSFAINNLRRKSFRSHTSGSLR